MKNFKTSDLGLAAFLVMKGIMLNSATKNRGRFEFVFDDPSGLGYSMSIEYVNSDFSKFDAQLKNLKNILNNS
jgi:hypothetical protein